MRIIGPWQRGHWMLVILSIFFPIAASPISMTSEPGFSFSHFCSLASNQIPLQDEHRSTVTPSKVTSSIAALHFGQFMQTLRQSYDSEDNMTGAARPYFF